MFLWSSDWFNVLVRLRSLWLARVIISVFKNPSIYFAFTSSQIMIINKRQVSFQFSPQMVVQFESATRITHEPLLQGLLASRGTKRAERDDHTVYNVPPFLWILPRFSVQFSSCLFMKLTMFYTSLTSKIIINVTVSNKRNSAFYLFIFWTSNNSSTDFCCLLWYSVCLI